VCTDILNGCSVGLFIVAVKTVELIKNSPYSGVRFEELCKTA